MAGQGKRRVRGKVRNERATQRGKEKFAACSDQCSIRDKAQQVE